MAIQQLSRNAQLLVPRDARGAIIVKGLHANKVIDKLNEIVAEYSVTMDTLNKIKVAEYDYRGPMGGGNIHFEDLKPLINVINALIARDSLTALPLSEQLIYDNSFRTPDDTFLVTKYNLDAIYATLNTIVKETATITVVNPIPDQVLSAGFGTHRIDMSKVFKSSDGTYPVTWVVQSNSVPAVVTTIHGKQDLILVEVGLGVTTIVVRGFNQTDFADDSFTVTVS